LPQKSSNDVGTILLTDEKIITDVAPKTPKNHQLYTTVATKKIAFTTKRLRTRSAFRQSLVASVGESQVVKKKNLILLDHGVKVIKGCYSNVMLL